MISSRACAALALTALALLPARAMAFEYPTSGRVVYVEQCMAENPGPHYEMVAKCSCVLDHIMQSTPYDDFVTMQTATDANTIAGERGNAIRDAEDLQKEIRTFRTLQETAKKSCFIGFMQNIR